MRWLRRRQRPEPEVSAEAQQRIESARQVREENEQRLAEVCDRWPEVNAVVAKSQQQLRRNGFAEMFARAMRGADGPSTG
jgi:hypothetical protein